MSALAFNGRAVVSLRGSLQVEPGDVLEGRRRYRVQNLCFTPSAAVTRGENWIQVDGEPPAEGEELRLVA